MYEDNLDLLFKGSVATGGDVFIPSAVGNNEEDLTPKDIMNDLRGFSRLMAGMENNGSNEGSSARPTPVASGGDKKQKVSAVVRIERGL